MQGMSELTIRTDRDFASVRPQAAVKSERTSAAGQSRPVGPSTGPSVSDGLQRLMTNLGQAENRSRDSRRALQSGEAVLDEVHDALERIAQLARKAAGGGNPDRAALQAELEQLRDGVDRMLKGALAGDLPLFLEDGLEDPSLALPDSPSSAGVPDLPLWLTRGLAQGSFSAQQLLSALGLDKGATGAQLLAAIQNVSLEESPAAGYLAALYLGSVIAGSSDPANVQQALEGLRQLMDKIAQGLSPDEAVKLLTRGEFTSLEDFQAQFTAGSAPGLQDFLSGLLLADGAALPAGSPLLALMADFGSMDLELMLALLTALPGQEAPPAGAAPPDGGTDVPGGTAQPLPDPTTTAQEAPAQLSAPGMSTLPLGGLQVTGPDLSGVSFDESTGVLTVSGGTNVLLQGTGQEVSAIRLTGPGQVTLLDVNAAVLTADAPEAQVLTLGQNSLGSLLLGENARLTLGGGGLLHLGALEGGPGSALRLTGGAVVVENREDGSPLTLPIVVDGPVLLAARAANVTAPSGQALEPADLLWRALLPDWSSVTDVTAEGRHARMLLHGQSHPEALRLWLYKGDPSHGYPLHALAFRGRDRTGQLRTRYAYLRWSQKSGRFAPVPMYPNPFSVTGGEAGQDWVYEEESHTLRILSGQVTAVSGGAGTDANQEPFSGRIALADAIGSLRLELDGVVCRVNAGKAFDLGRNNNVTLVLCSGKFNSFESGAGRAGIFLGEGTHLNVDRNARPAGTLSATFEAAAQPDEPPQWPGIPLQMGGETVLLPQFRMSAKALRLNRLSVATQERARSAEDILQDDMRWVERVQKVYRALYYRLERSLNTPHHTSHYPGTAEPLRDKGSAGTMLEDTRRSILLQGPQVMRSHSRRGPGDVGELLR